jgi:hypothetical protein
LEHVARGEHTNVAGLLERAMDEWLARRAAPDDEDVQQRLRRAPSSFIGAVRGGDPARSANVRARVRTVLARRRER